MPLTPQQKEEIDRLRSTTATTRRATVPALEEILYEAIPVLDHGFVRVIDYMGDDAAVVQAARVSYGRGTKKVSEDKALIFYLLRHRHTTPFEMCEIKYHAKLPIFIARQWIRHRTANVNEYSARYSILDNEFYLPAPEQLAAQSSTNRQGRGETLTGDEAKRVLDLLREDSERAYRGYVELLNEDEEGRAIDPGRSSLARDQPLHHVEPAGRETGAAAAVLPERLGGDRDPALDRSDHRLGVGADLVLRMRVGAQVEEMQEIVEIGLPVPLRIKIEGEVHAGELAREAAAPGIDRMNLSLNFYTQWYWKTDLHNLLNFLDLRADAHAQYEIRAYAEAMIGTVERWVPVTAGAFRQYRRGGTRLSAGGLEVVKRLIAGEPVAQAESGLTKREWNELMAALGKSVP